MFAITNVLVYFLILCFFGFILFLLIKQIQFVILAIPLYKEMVSNQQSMISHLGKIKDGIETLHATTMTLNERKDITPTVSKDSIVLKEINL